MLNRLLPTIALKHLATCMKHKKRWLLFFKNMVDIYISYEDILLLSVTFFPTDKIMSGHTDVTNTYKNGVSSTM
jgi:hypothetical protein